MPIKAPAPSQTMLDEPSSTATLCWLNFNAGVAGVVVAGGVVVAAGAAVQAAWAVQQAVFLVAAVAGLPAQASFVACVVLASQEPDSS